MSNSTQRYLYQVWIFLSDAGESKKIQLLEARLKDVGLDASRFRLAMLC